MTSIHNVTDYYRRLLLLGTNLGNKLPNITWTLDKNAFAFHTTDPIHIAELNAMHKSVYEWRSFLEMDDVIVFCEPDYEQIFAFTLD